MLGQAVIKMLTNSSILDGKYKILEAIGQGGTSIVYRALRLSDNLIFAIKQIKQSYYTKYDIGYTTFLHETEILKRLSHPLLPRIWDVFENGGVVYMVMDYIDGINLNTWLRQKGPQAQEDVIRWSEQICDVLSYLHSCSPPIIYRDMKPSNIILKPDGNIALIDFGTAREYKYSSLEDTNTLGTYGYAAPEQFGGRGQTDGRTDIYSLGVTLFYLLTGEDPTMREIGIFSVKKYKPGLSEELDRIILKCTKSNPLERYQSCEEVLKDLQKAFSATKEPITTDTTYDWLMRFISKYYINILLVLTGLSLIIMVLIIGVSCSICEKDVRMVKDNVRPYGISVTYDLQESNINKAGW